MPLVHRLAAAMAAVATLAGCSSESGTVNPFQPPPTLATTAGGNGTTGGIFGSQSAPKTTAPAAGTGSKWAISMPDSLLGYPRVTPNSSQQQQIDADWKLDTDQLGVSGQSISAVYDDVQDDYYLIVLGVNGSGFNPGNLHNLKPPPAPSLPEPDDSLTQEMVPVDPGPHGGDDMCDYVSTIMHMDTSFMGRTTVVDEETGCDWMTTTTAGGFIFINKGDQKLSGKNGSITPTVAAQVLIQTRDAVEHRQS